jgi:hypothetical protein
MFKSTQFLNNNKKKANLKSFVLRVRMVDLLTHITYSVPTITTTSRNPQNQNQTQIKTFNNKQTNSPITKVIKTGPVRPVEP